MRGWSCGGREIIVWRKTVNEVIKRPWSFNKNHRKICEITAVGAQETAFR